MNLERTSCRDDTLESSSGLQQVYSTATLSGTPHLGHSTWIRFHSDFDYKFLTHDRERALQFSRWKAWVKESCLSTTSVPGAVLKGVTNGLSLADDPLSWKFGTTSTLLVLSTWSFWMN